MTTIYLMRHSEGINKLIEKINTSDSVQLQNEKNILSVNGEKLAERVSKLGEFKNIDIVYSSNYVRAVGTAKYFAYQNNLKLKIDERLKERVQGINRWDELPIDFEKKQFLDEEYKIGFGENQLEVRKRMEEVVNEILEENKDKRILIVSHVTAISFLLKKWCDVTYNKNYYFQNKAFFDGQWQYCTCFKMVFDGHNLLDINVCYN